MLLERGKVTKKLPSNLWQALGRVVLSQLRPDANETDLPGVNSV